jgi:hypothetical protein
MYFSSFLIVLLLGIVSADLLVPVKKIESKATTDYVTTDLKKLDNSMETIEGNIKTALKTQKGDELSGNIKSQLTSLIDVVGRTTHRHKQLYGPFRKTLRHATNALHKLNSGHEFRGNGR